VQTLISKTEKLHYNKQEIINYWIDVVELGIIVAGSRRDWLSTLKLTLNTIKQPVERPAMIYLNQIKSILFF